MIRMSRQNRDGAVELLQQHDAHELVRPGRGAEREHEVGAALELDAESVGAADDEDGGRACGVAPALQRGGERIAVESLAALVERHDDRALRDDVGERDRLLQDAAGGVLGPALADFDDLDVADSYGAGGPCDARARAVGQLPPPAPRYAAPPG